MYKNAINGNQIISFTPLSVKPECFKNVRIMALLKAFTSYEIFFPHLSGTPIFFNAPVIQPQCTHLWLKPEGTQKQFKLYFSPAYRFKEILFRKQYHRDFVAPGNISFDIGAGEMPGIIGWNGAGKSPLLKILSGIVIPDSGSILIAVKVTGLPEPGTGFNERDDRSWKYLHGRDTHRYDPGWDWPEETDDHWLFRAGGVHPRAHQDVFFGYDDAALRSLLRFMWIWNDSPSREMIEII